MIAATRAQGQRLATVVDGTLAALVLESLPDATAVLDSEGNIVAVNRAWRMFALDNEGHAPTTGVGVNYFAVCERAAANNSDDAAQVLLDLRAVLSGDLVESSMEYRSSDAIRRNWFEVRISRLRGPLPGAVVVHRNINRRKLSELGLARPDRSHDPLTGLANGALLEARLSAALAVRPGNARVSGVGVGVGVVMISVDGTKSVNAAYGEVAADNVLQAVAYRLRRLVRAHDTVARLGGYRFAIVAPNSGRQDLVSLTNRTTSSLAGPHQIDGDQITVSATVTSHLATAGDDAHQVLFGLR
jgi:diguanylate cyclase (GGDEF)-like protein